MPQYLYILHIYALRTTSPSHAFGIDISHAAQDTFAKKMQAHQQPKDHPLTQLNNDAQEVELKGDWLLFLLTEKIGTVKSSRQED